MQRVIAYSSGEESTHSVDPVTRGERTTLALWFTTDPDHSKDGILLPQLQSALQRALSRVPGGSFQTVIPYPNDPPDTFFVEPEAWSRESLGPNVGSGKDSAERVGTDPDLENGTDAVSRQETTEQPAALEEIGAAASSTNKADRQEAKRARYADTADTFLGNAFEEVSKAEESGGAILSFAAGKGDLRCERLKELGLRFVSESGNTGRDEESPEVVLPEVVSEVVPDVVPEAVQSGEWRPVEDGAILAGQALVSAGVSGDVRNVPGSETAESHMVADKSGRSGNQTPEGELESQGEDLGADGMVPLQWLGGEAFGAEFRSRLHALQVGVGFRLLVVRKWPGE